jgi:hypothetical protein
MAPHIPPMTKKEREPTERHPETETGASRSETPAPREIGGPKGPEPTRYGDWEYNGRCTDF